MNILAGIFDLDGTVLNDEDLYGEVFTEILEGLGATVTKKYPQIGGIGVQKNWEKLLDEYKIKTSKSISELSKITQEVFLERVYDVTLKDGFEEIIEGMRSVGILTALATSNEWFVVEKIIDDLGIGEYFDAIVTAEEAIAPKPDPDIFIQAAKKLGVEPADVVIFEDSAAGVSAGREIGAKVFAIYRDKNHKEELANADYLISDFYEGYQKLNELLAESEYGS